PDHHADRHHVVAHRVDERAAELPVAATGAQRPAHRVDDPVERLRDLPDLLDAERPHLRVLAVEPEPVERCPGQVALRAFGQDRDPSHHIRPGFEVPELLAGATTAAVAGPDADDAPAV